MEYISVWEIYILFLNYETIILLFFYVGVLTLFTLVYISWFSSSNLNKADNFGGWDFIYYYYYLLLWSIW
jgi:hypothetical protein